MAAAEPPLDALVDRLRSHGFRVGPNRTASHRSWRQVAGYDGAVEILWIAVVGSGGRYPVLGRVLCTFGSRPTASLGGVDPRCPTLCA